MFAGIYFATRSVYLCSHCVRLCFIEKLKDRYNKRQYQAPYENVEYASYVI